jgi:RND family efflux transporter MFP subunit
MKLPEFTQKPLIRCLALVPPALLLLILGVRFLVPVEALSAPVDRGPVSMDVRGTGTLESVQEVPLAFKVGGRIQDLPLDEGSLITKGQVLGRLDPNDLREQLAVAHAARGAAQAGIGKAQADMEQVLANRQRARSDFERMQRLQREGILSRADLDVAQERLKVTEAAVQAMGAVGTHAQQGESLAKGTEALQQLAFEEGRLLSPVDGLLTRRLREPGNIVSAGTPVLTVVSTRKLWVRAWVDESALGRLQIGQSALVALRSHPGRTFPGRVDRIGRQSDRQTHELLVDVEVLELPPIFAVGQRADVQIQTSGLKAALRVPSTYLDKAGFLFVDRGGRAHHLQPGLGLRGSDFVEIRSGLNEGERVLRPSQAGTLLGSGRRVSLKEGA